MNQPTGTGALATHVGRLANLARMAHVVHLAYERLLGNRGPTGTGTGTVVQSALVFLKTTRVD